MCRSDVRTRYLDEDLSVRVGAWLGKPVPAGFPGWSIERRLATLAGEAPAGDGRVYRDRVCAREVWLECLGGCEGDYNKGHARDINQALQALGWTAVDSFRFGAYGRGRGYLRPEGAA